MKKRLLILLCFLLCGVMLISCGAKKEPLADTDNSESDLESDVLVEDEKDPTSKVIELSYHCNKQNSIIIEDQEEVAILSGFLSQAGGTKGESSAGYYGVPYTLRLYSLDNEAESITYFLWNEAQYSTNRDLDEKGYPYFYNDDLSGLYTYLEQQYPDSFWYGE